MECIRHKVDTSHEKLVSTPLSSRLSPPPQGPLQPAKSMQAAPALKRMLSAGSYRSQCRFCTFDLRLMVASATWSPVVPSPCIPTLGTPQEKLAQSFTCSIQPTSLQVNLPEIWHIIQALQPGSWFECNSGIPWVLKPALSLESPLRIIEATNMSTGIPGIMHSSPCNLQMGKLRLMRSKVLRLSH